VITLVSRLLKALGASEHHAHPPRCAWQHRASHLGGAGCFLAGRQNVAPSGEGDDASGVVEALEAQSSCARSFAEATQGGSQSSGAQSFVVDWKRGSQWCAVCSLAGMTKTSTCPLHETDLAGCRKTSTLVLQLTVREGVCRGASSGPQPRMELRRKRDERPETVLVLLALFAVQAFGGIWMERAAGFMLWGSSMGM